MNREDLIQLGLTKNESEIYIVLISFREADAQQIIRETKYHKKVVYDNLQRLVDKGLVTSIIRERRKVFSIAPMNFYAYIEDQEKMLERKKEIADRVQEEIDSLKVSLQEKQEATIYDGISAIKSFYTETLRSGDYYVLGAPDDSIEVMGNIFWDNYHLKRKKNKQKVYLLLNQSLKKWGEKQKDRYIEVRYLDKDFEPKTEIHIQRNVVAIIVWAKNPILFRITSKIVADSYKKYFDQMWSIAKP